jgi:hypothetical protein
MTRKYLAHSVRLLANVEGQWREVDFSSVIDVSVDEVLTLLPDSGLSAGAG